MKAIAIGAFVVVVIVFMWLLTSCEPCAVVLGGHCTGQQEDKDFDKQAPGEIELPPEPYGVPRGRG